MTLSADTPETRFIESACIAAVGHHSPADWKAAEAVRLLDPSIVEEDFSCALVYGDAQTVTRMLNADPALARRKAGHRQWEPMLYLCFSGYAAADSPRKAALLETAQLLIQAGAEVNPRFLSNPIDLQSKDPQSEERAIYGAAGIYNNPELTRLLLISGADPNDGETPYHAPEHHDIAALKVLWQWLYPDSRATVLLRLCDSHNFDALEWTLDHGADPNHRGRWEDQALHHSLRRLNAFPFQQLIVRKGGDPNGQTRSGMSVFQMAALRGRQDVIDLITARGAVDDLTETQRFLYALATSNAAQAKAALIKKPDLIAGLSDEELLAMNSAAGQGHLEAVRLMIEVGMPIDRHGVNGDTPLHYAASMGHLPVVRLLVEAHAPLHARQMQGLTPKQLAEEFLCKGWVTKHEMREIIAFLEQAEAQA
ncbi:MAG TPA: ankyrin repeat domain-containing protein [Candidatus Saccharimonadales bacterium]|jgi:ankyrin repeat protein|nr:ankyrin repeat domain-containing protein [Candidatus Saccharimonadales bacterium]